MAKRKRTNGAEGGGEPRKAVKPTTEPPATSPHSPNTIRLQIVTGSYERVLHGITATIPQISHDDKVSDQAVEFTDAFLFQAHASAIRCLALSPLSNVHGASSQNLVLASGSTDERVNLYNLSISPPAANDKFPSVSTLAGNKVLENPDNRELGSLLHHSSTITALSFPTRSKLLAASDDNTISVIKTRDWSVVSTIKAPRPKVHGRPSGDTAPPGSGPAGINDFAIHPSMKLMLSVGKGERCMRLWNLVTGKKAGVLDFGRELVQSVKEGKWSSGEGRKIVWDSQGEEFAVAFERGVVVFGTDCEARCRILPNPLTKIHHIAYVNVGSSSDESDELLAISTEKGEVLFCNTKHGLSKDPASPTPLAAVRCQVGGKSQGQSTRIKEFEVLSLRGDIKHGSTRDPGMIVVTCSSDGRISLWHLSRDELRRSESKSEKPDTSNQNIPQVGKLLGSYESGDRVTCLKAFVMTEPTDELDAAEDEDVGSDDEDEEEGDDDDESSDSDSEE